MANIRENKRDGKLVSYRFTVCLGRDANNKQIRRYTTWEVPEGLTPAKAKKAAERAADAWERETREEYQKEKEQGQAYTLPPEKRRDSFTAFVNDVWFPLQVCNGNDKQTTITFYKNMKKLIVKYFDGMVLQEISPLHIQKFLAYLSRDYKTKQGKPLAPKTIRHYFKALDMIFAYADMQEATNSHDYYWDEDDEVEEWTEKLEERDWAALERSWSNAYDAPGGEVMD